MSSWCPVIDSNLIGCCQRMGTVIAHHDDMPHDKPDSVNKVTVRVKITNWSAPEKARSGCTTLRSALISGHDIYLYMDISAIRKNISCLFFSHKFYAIFSTHPCLISDDLCTVLIRCLSLFSSEFFCYFIVGVLWQTDKNSPWLLPAFHSELDKQVDKRCNLFYWRRLSTCM